MILRNNTHDHVMKKRLSISEIKARTKDEPFDLISTEYLNAHVKLDWRCHNCESIFQSSWLNISFGWGCPICKGKKASIRIKEMRKSRGAGMDVREIVKLLQTKGLEFVEYPEDYINNLGKKVTLRCLVCDRSVKIRLQDIKTKTGYGCWDCNRTKGKDSHFWRGGRLKDYPVEWNNHLRESIRNRDSRRCQYPKCSYSDVMGSVRLHVHHINGNKQDCRNVNLVSLCNKHHMKIESTRPRDWEEYFYAITNDYEWRKI